MQVPPTFLPVFGLASVELKSDGSGIEVTVERLNPGGPAFSPVVVTLDVSSPNNFVTHGPRTFLRRHSDPALHPLVLSRLGQFNDTVTVTLRDGEGYAVEEASRSASLVTEESVSVFIANVTQDSDNVRVALGRNGLMGPVDVMVEVAPVDPEQTIGTLVSAVHSVHFAQGDTAKTLTLEKTRHVSQAENYSLHRPPRRQLRAVPHRGRAGTPPRRNKQALGLQNQPHPESASLQ